MSDKDGLTHREKLYLVLLAVVAVFTIIYLVMRNNAAEQVAAATAAAANNQADPDTESALIQAALESAGTSSVQGVSVSDPSASTSSSVTSSIGSGDPTLDNVLSGLTNTFLNYNAPSLSDSTIAAIGDNSSQFISALQSNDPITQPATSVMSTGTNTVQSSSGAPLTYAPGTVSSPGGSSTVIKPVQSVNAAGYTASV